MVTGIACCVYVAWAVLGSLENIPARDIVLYNVILLLVVALLVAHAIASRNDRWAWMLMAIGVLCWTVGNYAFTAITSHLAEPNPPSVGEWLYLAFYPFALASIVLLLRQRFPRPTSRVVLDGLLVALTVAAIMALPGVAVYDMSALESETAGWPEIVFAIATPAGDLLLTSMLITLLGLLVWKAEPMWWLLTGAAATLWVCNTAWLLDLTNGDPLIGALLDAGWLLAFVAIGCGPWLRTRNWGYTPTGWRSATVPVVMTTIAFGLLLNAALVPAPRLDIYLASAAIVVGLTRMAQSLSDSSRQAEMSRQLYIDDLTGLANRRMLNSELNESVEDFKSGPAALLILDLDAFKDVNDLLGHSAGDEVLCEVAPRLASVLRSTDTVARLGGDEFAILLRGTGLEGAKAVAERINIEFQRPFEVGGIELAADVSIGIALSPEHASTSEELLCAADLAMYRAKNRKLEFAVFDPALDRTERNRVRLIQQLRVGLRAEELTCDFQPKLDLASGKVTSVEALVRWDHPDRGRLLPDQFLPQAEQAGLMSALAHRVIDVSLAAVSRWNSQGIRLSAAVNLSATNLLDPTLTQTIVELLERHGLRGNSLTLEITETTLMTEPDNAREVVAGLRGLGVTFSVDDYGTGFSSLSQVRNVSAGELKIDRSFISELSVNADSLAIVRTTVELAHELGMRVVAEGVESEADLNILRAIGCDIAQGYVICRPVPADLLEVWIRSRTGTMVPTMSAPTPANRRAVVDSVVDLDVARKV